MIVSYTDYGRDYVAKDPAFSSGQANPLFFLQPNPPVSAGQTYYEQIKVTYAGTEYLLDFYFAFDGQGQKLFDSFDVFDLSYRKLANVVDLFVPITAGALDYKNDQFYLSDAKDDWYDGGGSDYLDLSGGNDLYHYASGQDQILGGPGFDQVQAPTVQGIHIVPAGDDWFEVRSASDETVFSVKQVERLSFADSTFALYPDGWREEHDGTDVFRFYNTATGVHFYTGSTAEKDRVITTYPQFLFEGMAFDVPSLGEADFSVFRFYNTRTGTHFYTASEAERDQVIATHNQYVYEGVAYGAYAGAGGGEHTALYRFYNEQTGTHFYTASESERQNVIETLPQYKYEGIAYYVDLA